jgi:hypothetical protein
MLSRVTPARAAARSWAMTAATAASIRRGESRRSLARRRRGRPPAVHRCRCGRVTGCVARRRLLASAARSANPRGPSGVTRSMTPVASVAVGCRAVPGHAARRRVGGCEWPSTPRWLRRRPALTRSGDTGRPGRAERPPRPATAGCLPPGMIPIVFQAPISTFPGAATTPEQWQDEEPDPWTRQALIAIARVAGVGSGALLRHLVHDSTGAVGAIAGLLIVLGSLYRGASRWILLG